jgi:hypothetical protein
MTAKEMAILDKPKEFKQINRPRFNKKLADKSVQALSELDFIFKQIPVSYRFKILSNEKCNQLFKTILSIHNVNLSELDSKSRDLIIHVAAQLLIDAITVLNTTMPVEFKRPLHNSAEPLLDLLKAITNFGRANKLKNVPSIEIPNLFIAEGQE